MISWSGTRAKFSRTGIRSVRTALPDAARNRVFRTFESVTYSRVTEFGWVGEIFQKPPLWRSRQAANTDGESKRGQQSHSTEPCFETSAAERQSPMIP